MISAKVGNIQYNTPDFVPIEKFTFCGFIVVVSGHAKIQAIEDKGYRKEIHEFELAKLT